MKGRVRRIVPLVVIAVGLLVLFYPTISNFLIMKNASRVVGNYDSQVNSLTDEQYQQMIDAAHEYNKRLAEQNAGATDALSGAVNTPSSDKEYNSLLNLNGDGMMGYLTVPRLKETMPIYHGTSEEVLQSGIGHLEQTSLPVGGDTTHAALSGHRGLPTAKLFTDLNLMKTGDKFYIKILKDTYAYQVDKIITVLPTDTKELVIEKGKDQVTLITCTPYAVNTHRLLVRAHRIPYTPAEHKDAQPTFHVDIPLQYALPSIALILFLIGWRIWRNRDEKRRRVDTAEQVVNSVLGVRGGAASATDGSDGSSQQSTASSTNPTRKGTARHGKHS
ncbi:class C sortase [Bifidobacterium amazonense]|uniref:Class C sortase n=1 Tax=Bifidobacterium amazonense TaxID=2809027 RepID=A0ABS9VX15_9BIFI|nr:class C sortase [Bifidobacterium amazonense]MCH9276660.1 class C sortase [Bifidobacterium amazonense]